MHASCRNIQKYKKAQSRKRKVTEENPTRQRYTGFMQQPSFENAHGLCCRVFGIRKGTDHEWIPVLLYHEHIEVLRMFLPALLGLDCGSDMVYLEWSPIVSCPSPLPSGSLLNPFGSKLLRILGPLRKCLLEHPWIHSRRLYSSPLNPCPTKKSW